MFPFLHVAECDSWHHLVTSNESWFSWIHHYVACGLCREMTWSQSRDLIFRVKHSCLQSCEIRAASILLTDSQMMPKWTSTILWQTYSFHLNKRSFLGKGRCIRNYLWFISTIAQSTQIRLEQIGSKNMACAACHTHPSYSPNLASVTSTCFLQWKKNSNGFRWLTRTSFLSPCKKLWGVSIKKNWIAYFKLGCGGSKK
jgi:hypothetical protein